MITDSSPSTTGILSLAKTAQKEGIPFMISTSYPFSSTISETYENVEYTHGSPSVRNTISFHVLSTEIIPSAAFL